MNRFIAFIIVIPAVISGGLLGAEEISYFDKDDYMASARYPETLELAMVDCIAMALKSNSEISIKRITPYIEDNNILIQKSRFEPHFTFDGSLSDSVEQDPSTLLGANILKTGEEAFDFGYNQKFTTGADLELDFFNTRTNSNSPTFVPNPAYESEAEITITQPLLKGGGIAVNTADFRIAKNNKLKSAQDFKTEVIKVLTNVKKSYYDFQYSREQYIVAQKSLMRVEDLHRINKEKYAKGLASDIDITESEAEVARIRQALYEAEAIMKLAEDSLKLITNLVDDPALWNARIVLLEGLEYEKRDVDLPGAIKTAFIYRPDYEAAKIDLRNRDIAIVVTANGMLPTINLLASFGLNGLDAIYAKDLANVGGGKYNNWTVGFNVDVPLIGDENRGKYERSKSEKEQALLAFQRLEQKIILDVRNVARNIDINYRKLEASSISKESEDKNYTAQELRFKAGLVSTLDIVIYQERLARAEVSYVKSIIDYNVSLIELSRAQGTMLFDDNITLEES
ncbi:MAG: TolC family protein [Candidatus Omnitrophota bacterium]|nr:TolC family protein [Candidatus Omnitrophota bacterium]